MLVGHQQLRISLRRWPQHCLYSVRYGQSHNDAVWRWCDIGAYVMSGFNTFAKPSRDVIIGSQRKNTQEK